MKKILLSILLLCLCYCGFAATYYYKTSVMGSCHVETSWSTTADGIGSSPTNANFLLSNVFIIGNSAGGTGPTAILTTNWAPNAASTIVVGYLTQTGSVLSITNTLTATAGNLSVLSGNELRFLGAIGTYTNSGLVNTLASGSTVNYASAGNQTILARNYSNLTSSSTGARTLANTGTIGVEGVFTPFTNGYTITGSTINFNSTVAQTIPAFNYNNLTSSSTGARTLAGSGTIGVAAVFTPGTNSYTIPGSTINFNGTVAQTIPAFNYNNLTSSSTGGRTLANTGTIGVAGVFTPFTNTYTIIGSTVDFNGTGAQGIPLINFNNITVSNARIGTPTFTLPNGTINVSGNIIYSATGMNPVWVNTGSTINFNGTVAQTIGALNYNNLTSSSTGTRTLVSTGIIGIAGVFTPGINTYAIAGSTVDFNGTGAQTIPAISYNNLTLSGARVGTPAITLASGTINIAGNGINSSTGAITWINNGSTVDFNGTGVQTIPSFNYNNLTSSSTGARTLANTGTIGVASVFTPSTNAYTITGSTINFNGTVAQTIPAFNYYNLTSSSTGARTLANTGTIGVESVFTPFTNLYTITGSTINFNGTVAQTIPAFNYNNLTSSLTGARTLAGSGTIGVAGVFTPFTNGYTITGSTVDFNGTTPQPIPAFNYFNLTSSSTGARTLANTGTIGVAGVFTPFTNAYTVLGSTVNYNAAGPQTVVPRFTYDNLIISGSGIKTLGVSIALGDIATTINSTLTINNGCTFNIPVNAFATNILAGAFTTSSDVAAASTTAKLIFSSNSTNCIPPDKTYNFQVEYNGTGNQSLRNGTFNSPLTISGIKAAGAINECQGGGKFTIMATLIHTATYSGLGNFNPNFSDFTFQAEGPQLVPGGAGNTIRYYNLSLYGSGVKTVTDAQIIANGTLSVSADAYSTGDPIYDPTAALQFIYFRPPFTRTRSSVDAAWNRINLGNAVNSKYPNIIKVGDAATIFIDDLAPISPTFAQTQARLVGANLEINGGGRVTVNANCRLDILRNLTTTNGGELGGVASSRIHISDVANQSIGRINSQGFVNFDKNAGTATFSQNINAADMYIWNTNDGPAGTGGLYSFNPAASITTTASLNIGVKDPGAPLLATHRTSTTLRLLLNNANLLTGATHEHTVGGNFTQVNGDLDFTSGTLADPRSSILNVAGNFIKSGGFIYTADAVTASGQINFNGSGSPIQNIAIDVSSEVSFLVKNPTSVLFTGNVVSVTGRENFVLETGTTANFSTYVLQTPGGFVSNGGVNLLTANANGFNSGTPATIGSVQTNAQAYKSTDNYTFNGIVAQITGNFLPNTAPEGSAVNNFTFNNSSSGDVTLSHDFMVVNGLFTPTLGRLNIAGQKLELKGDIANSGTGTIKGSPVPVSRDPSLVITNPLDITVLEIEGNGPISGTLRMDQTTPGISNFVTFFAINRGGNPTLKLGNDFGVADQFAIGADIGSNVLRTGTEYCKVDINGNTIYLNGQGFPGPGVAPGPIGNRETNCFIGSATSRMIFASNTNANATSNTTATPPYSYNSSTRFYMDQSVPGTSNFLKALYVSRPTGGQVLLAPNGAYGNPVIVDSLSVTGGMLNLNSNELTITGRVQLAATSCIRASTNSAPTASRLNIAGSGPIGGSIFMDNTGLFSTAGVSKGTNAANDLTLISPGIANNLDRLTINRSGETITLGNTMQISGSVVPTVGILASAGNLVMLSTETITSNIAAGGLASGSSNITGDVVVQSFFKGSTQTSSRGFRMISVPVVEQTAPNNIFTIMKQRFIITGTGGVTNGFDAGGAKEPFATTLMSYNEPGLPTASGSYNRLADISTASTPGLGYFFFFRGNRSNATTTKVNDVGGVFVTPEDWTATYIGAINKGDVTVSNISRGTSGTDNFNGYNLLGNPYPCTIDFDVFRTNTNASNSSDLSDLLVILKRDRTGYITRSGGVNNNISVVEGTIGTGSPSIQYIQPGQGFMVRKTGAGNTSVRFTEACKITNQTPLRLLSTPAENDLVLSGLDGKILNKKIKQNIAPKRQLIRLDVQNGTDREQATLVLEEGNEAIYGGYDAPYLGNGDVFFNTLTSDGVATAINFLPTIDKVSSVKLNVAPAQSQPNLKFNFTELTALGNAYDMFLKDNYLQTQTLIENVSTIYNFAVDKSVAATFGRNRFELVFTPKEVLSAQLTNFGLTQQSNGIGINWSTSSETNTDKFVVEKSADGVLFNTLTIKAAAGNSFSTLNYNTLDKNPINGINYYRLLTIDKNGDQKYSKVESIVYGIDANGLTVYPNPVKETLNVSWKALNTASSLEIYNLDGKLLLSTNLKIKANTAKINVNNLDNGVYLLRLKSQLKTQSVIKFIKQ